MPGYYRIRFLPEGRVQEFAGIRGVYYALGDGSRIDLHSGPVWCRHCGTVRHGEEIPTLAGIDAQILKTERLAAEIRYEMTTGYHEPDAPGDAFQQERLTELRRRRRWLQGRVSPPRCIHCGSTDILLLPIDRPFRHPSGRGTIVVEFVGLCSTDFLEWYFTPEGERIVTEGL